MEASFGRRVLTPEASCSNVGGGAPNPFLVLAARRPFPPFLAAKPDERLKVAARHMKISTKDLKLDDTIVLEVGEPRVEKMKMCGRKLVRPSFVPLFREKAREG